MSHPAQFSTEVTDEIASFLRSRHEHDSLYAALAAGPAPLLWDPFAGPGVRLAAMAAQLDLDYGGTEIERSFIIAPNIREGDATDITTYPIEPYIIVTSPAYPNGMADSWAAKDASTRKTYRKAIAEIEGADRPLHENNQGALGYRGTKRHGKSLKRTRYWEVASKAVACWGSAELVILNVSDFKHGNGQVEPVVQDWRDLLYSYGWNNQTPIPVATRRMRHGQNADERVDVEMIVVCER